MRMNEGVEWALHCCLNLSWVGDEAVTAARLAAFYELPTAYLNKQLQALARAGILSSVSGPKGGFRLNRRPDKITLLDVVVAIDGPEEAFRCSQILRAAELAYRRELASRTLADIKAEVERAYPGTDENTRRWFAGAR